MRAQRPALAAALALPLAIGLLGCTSETPQPSPKETAGRKETPSTGKKAAAKAPAATTGVSDAEATKVPCGDDDQKCWQLPRVRAEFDFEQYPDERGITLDKDNEAISFFYGFPKELQREQKLTAFLRKDADQLYRQWIGVARRDQAKAVRMGIPPGIYERIVVERRWAVTGRAPRLIGLIQADGDVSIHEQVIERPVIWDRQTGKFIGFKDLFVDPEAALRRIRSGYCPLLKKEVVEREPSSIEDSGTSSADYCPPLSDFPPPVLAGGRDGKIDGFLILLGHFRVYAEGPYQVEVPATAELIALIKPEYRADFRYAR